MTVEGIKKGTTMKKYIITLTLIFAAQVGAQYPNLPPPKSGAAQSKMSLEEAIFILGRHGLFGKQRIPTTSRFSAGCDCSTINQSAAMDYPSSRESIRRKLMNIRLREVSSLEGFTLSEAVEVLETMFGKANGINFIFDTAYDPEKIAKNPNENDPNNNSGEIDPTTGLPAQLGNGANEPQVDPATGLPVGSSGGNSPLPGLNGLPAGLPLPPTQSQKTFDPEIVKITGMPPKLFNVTAMQLLDILVEQADAPITYAIGDASVVFMKADPKLRGLSTRIFRLNLNSRTLQQFGVKPPKLGGDNLRPPAPKPMGMGGNGQQPYGHSGFPAQTQTPMGGRFFPPSGPIRSFTPTRRLILPPR